VLTLSIPGFQVLELEHLVCDYNGTLARDGHLLDGVKERLARLAGSLSLHVVTADTFGQARTALAGMDLRLTVLPSNAQDVAKAEYLKNIGAARAAAIGNGRNDRDMLNAAALSIAVVGPEGAAADTLTAADVVALDILAALDLLTNPQRLVATLRR
jgi:soluble P-type ATPase